MAQTTKTYIKFKSQGFHQIINAAGTARVVHDAAYSMATRAGGLRVREIHGGYGGGRPVAFVVTDGKDAKEAAAQRRALQAAAIGGL